MEKSIPHSVTQDTLWSNCIHVVLSLLEENLFQEENSTRPTKSLFVRENCTQTWENSTGLPGQLPNYSDTYTTCKRKRSLAEDARDRKMQRISSCLANDIARSLSFHDPTLSSTPSAEESRLHKDQDMLHSSSTSFHPRVYRKWTHSQLSHSMNGHSTPYQEISPTEEHSFSPLPTLRRISLSGALNLSSDMDLEKWLMMQAHQQHMSVSAYKALFQEKKQQLHTCLHTLHTLNIHHPGLDITDQYEEIKATLGRILNIADELSGDHLLSFAAIFPEWRECEGYLGKLASYVQSIEDMKQLSAFTIPRTEDLLSDIKNLQSLLEAKHQLYGEALIQNGLEWKAMGMPVDDHLLASTKGWFYSLSIGLLNELDTECSKAQSLVSSMRELVNRPPGEKLMGSILHGVELISDIVVFIGLPSRKLTFGCHVLATIYGHWISENIGYLNDLQLNVYPCTGPQSSIQQTPGSFEQPLGLQSKAHAKTKVEIRLMQCLENMIRLLSALQTFSENSGGRRSAKEIEPLSSKPEDGSMDFDALSVLDNLTAILVEILVKAVTVVETNRSKAGNSTLPKSGNIMVNPQMVLVYLQEILLSFADHITELAGRDWKASVRLKRMYARLEEIENSLSET